MKYQNLYNIIFSDDRAWRWKRHFLFWLAVFFYHLIRISMIYPVENIWESRWSLLEMAIFWGIILNVLFSYTVVYFLIPQYFHKKKYFSFIIGCVTMIVLLLSINTLHSLLLNIKFSKAVGFSFQNFLPFLRPQVIRFFGNPPLIFGLFLSLKTFKNWHLEQLKTETLAKENTHAELQLLKAQVHPHFLFNTLNNIYSFTLTQSPLAGILVQQLSDMLNYMVHECEQSFVPIEKEIKLIRDYMDLEKVRYGSRLNMEVEINGEYKNKMIAPLLMIPFVENCFKHGASVMRGQQWIRLSIYLKEDQLDFLLSNSKPPDVPDTDKKRGIGLSNVRKRLQLLYPGNHFLKIDSTKDAFTVHLGISLRQIVEEDIEFKLLPIFQPV